MSEFARLEEKLAKLRHRERAPGEVRKLRGADADALVQALVTEIDETILPRRLTLTAGPVALHLAVANRRLQALLAPTPDIKGAGELADKALPDAEDPAVPALLQVVTRAFSDGHPVEVSAMRLRAQFGSDVGVPANLLARAWNVKPTAPTPKNPGDVLGGYLQEISTDAIAWLRIEGEEVTDQNGPEDRVAALGEQAAVFLDGYFAKFDVLFPTDAKACGTVVSPKDGNSDALLFVEFGEVSAFIAVKPALVADLAGRWQRLVAD
ncbi:MAG: hypothetical protein HKN18_12490 [Silicimonas sp.]|nr:hypothetical protein [Silicimonas sp.]